MKTIKTLLLFAIVLAVNTKVSNAQESKNNIKITINNVHSSKGTLQVGLYNSAASFLGKTYRGISIKAKKGKVQVIFKNIPKGEYAVSLYHDVDNNKELNTIFGIPTEPYGTSNNAKGNFGPPKWEDAKFMVTQKETLQSITL